MRTVALYNIKGGVGKTSTAVNLAYLSALRGHRTLLWDLDAQGSATYILRVQPKVKGGGQALVRGQRPLDDALKATDFEGLDLLPADFTYRHLDVVLDDQDEPLKRLRQLLRTVRDDYDHVYLDCPPSMSLLSESVLHAADTVLVPLIPTTLSLRTMDMLREVVAKQPKRKPVLRGFFSMVDARKKLHRDVVAQLPNEHADISKIAIPSLSVVEQMAVRRAPVLDFALRTTAGRRYTQLWDELWSVSSPPPSP